MPVPFSSPNDVFKGAATFRLFSTSGAVRSMPALQVDRAVERQCGGRARARDKRMHRQGIDLIQAGAEGSDGWGWGNRAVGMEESSPRGSFPHVTNAFLRRGAV